jgi:quercetin dioxygenase-like cupin family protein
MPSRNSDLQQLLDMSQRIIAGSGVAAAMAAGERVFRRLGHGEGVIKDGVGERLPVCAPTVDVVLAGLATRKPLLPELASAFAAIEGRLRWYRRKTATPADEPFYSSHANALLIGPGGLEERNDVEVGVTVMAPHIVYPDHDHPPEEVYIALSPGEWWNAEMDWTEPGPGGIIYNPPGILHAMRSHREPFLALWFLPLG